VRLGERNDLFNFVISPRARFPDLRHCPSPGPVSNPISGNAVHAPSTGLSPADLVRRDSGFFRTAVPTGALALPPCGDPTHAS
jgi:hypothetical protein